MITYLFLSYFSHSRSPENVKNFENKKQSVVKIQPDEIFVLQIVQLFSYALRSLTLATFFNIANPNFVARFLGKYESRLAHQDSSIACKPPEAYNGQSITLMFYDVIFEMFSTRTKSLKEK